MEYLVPWGRRISASIANHGKLPSELCRNHHQEEQQKHSPQHVWGIRETWQGNGRHENKSPASKE
jgi:hypothetical protein